MRSRPRSGDLVRSLWRAELSRGRDLALAGDAEGARAAYARAQAMAPTEAEPAFALGRCEEQRGRSDEADRLYRVALAARPEWPLAAIALTRLVIARGQPNAIAAIAEARRVLAPARAAHPAHLLLTIVEAELLVEEGRPDAAKELLRSLGSDADSAPVVALALSRAENAAGIALSDEGRHDEALFAFKRACDLDPRWAPPRANLGALWQRLGKRKQALDQYQLALGIDPTHGLACFNRGMLLRDEGDLDGAARSFAAALTADPPLPAARIELALTLSDRGEHARAIELLEEALRAGNDQPAVLWTNLGVACVRAGNDARAEEAFQAALTCRPDHLAALRNLAHLYGRLGRLVEAAAMLRRAEGNSGAPPASK
ncbi:MAG: Tetratricopeptide 2 repeat protein [Myxococcales bacterium]|nr:Tetratricopeptide 2 repeat protein [Myxococcales bacterium]